MGNGTLGILERVELRDIWLSEASDFTPWLAGNENLAQLGKTIGMELELEAQEKNVGPFRADILCKDTATGDWVLVENQLEKTDHTHLGQLLTYAAGLKAVTIVWVAAQFTEEHRATLDWLNTITNEGFQFFGLEVELWKIGDSPAAPKFNIISKPNDWTRSVSQAARRIENETLTDTKAMQLEFWTEFSEFLKSGKSPIRPQKPYPQHWMNFSVGRSGFLLGALLNTPEKRIGVELYLNDDDAKSYFGLLSQEKQRIEEELGFPLNWMELPDRKSCRLLLSLEDASPMDRQRWPEYRQWMKERLERFNAVFRPRVRALNANDWRTEEEDA
jgi:hypothetical protein